MIFEVVVEEVFWRLFSKLGKNILVNKSVLGFQRKFKKIDLTKPILLISGGIRQLSGGEITVSFKRSANLVAHLVVVSIRS